MTKISERALIKLAENWADTWLHRQCLLYDICPRCGEKMISEITKEMPTGVVYLRCTKCDHADELY
jgi:hypothetical protein